MMVNNVNNVKKVVKNVWKVNVYSVKVIYKCIININVNVIILMIYFMNLQNIVQVIKKYFKRKN